MFKILFSLALALGIAGVAYAAAASLTVNGGVAQYGADDSLTCDTAVDIYKTTVSATDDEIDSITVAGISGSCVGSSIRVGLSGDLNDCEIANVPHTADVNEVFDGPFDCGDGIWHLEDLYEVHVTFY